MTTLSRVEAHKNFDTKVKIFVGKEIYDNFINLGVKICHVKKICIKLKDSVKGGLNPDVFKDRFLRICDVLISRLLYTINRSVKTVSDIISSIFKESIHGTKMI